VLLISLRRERSGDAPLRGIVHLGLAVIGICTSIALMAAYFHARSYRARRRSLNESTLHLFRNHPGRHDESFEDCWRSICSSRFFDGTASYFVLSRGETE
jgi:hypothetical protein